MMSRLNRVDAAMSLQNVRLTAISLTAASLLGSPVNAAETAQSVVEMASRGTVNLDFRYRFEYVDQEGIAKEAKASTLRSRLGFTSAQYRGFSFMAEVDDLSFVGEDNFNSTSNGNTDYPVVADPKGTDLNQAWLRYSNQDLSGTYGRQRILHGNQRFVGGVGWRQNEQTYDALRVQWQGPEGLAFDYAYVDTVQRIFGPDEGPVQPADLEGDNHLARLDWQINEEHSLAAFAYLLDIKAEEAYPAGRSVDNSSDTYGVEYAGKFGPVSAKAAYANQTEAGDSSLEYDAAYYSAELGVAIEGINGTIGFEVLEGDNGVGFKTPYATLHKFQGWADIFLVTPGDGIEDAYIGLSGKLGPVTLGATYHEFEANDSSSDFGTEFDAAATWPVNKHLSLQFKYANFDADNEGGYSDSEKVWVTVQAKL